MPELPEVETVARQLNSLICGAQLQTFEVIDGKLAGNWVQPLRKICIDRPPVSGVIRSGKQIVISFQGARAFAKQTTLAIAIHLRMTGNLLWQQGERTLSAQLSSRIHPHGDTAHLRAAFEFDLGKLLFVDIRRFGTIKLFTTPEKGVEPLGPDFTVRNLSALLKRARTQQIKQFLLRQDAIVGIGNIYASEILFHSRIHPQISAAALTTNQVKRLHKATQVILQRAIESGGTTFSDHVDTHNEPGRYQNELAVYGRENKPCLSCNRAICRIVISGRSTFCCRKCQKLPQRKYQAKKAGDY